MYIKQLLKPILVISLAAACGLASAQTSLSSMEAMARQMGISQSDIDSYKRQSMTSPTVGTGMSSMAVSDDVRRSTTVTDYTSDDDRSRLNYMDVITLMNFDPNTRYFVDNQGNLVVDSTYTAYKKQQVFGKNIFVSQNLSFSSNLNMPTPIDYKLSAGDGLIIDVWGASEANYKLKIVPDGSIFIPRVGPMQLAGLTIEEAESKIKSKLSTIYGKGSQIKVSLGAIRTIRVNMVGEVTFPGTYSVPSLTSLFNAMYNAGGVNDIGSMRDIKVYRSNKLVAELDAYKFILNGDITQNIRLEDNDVVIVEPNRNMVYMVGAVKRNMIFELLPGETLSDAITYAGGFDGDAFAENIRIYRKDGAGYHMRTVANGEFASEQLSDGDVVVVSRAISKFDNRVSIEGAVWQTGNYQLSERTNSLSKLIVEAQGLKPDAFLNRGYVVRVDDGYTSSVIPFDVMKAADGSMDIELKPDDKVVIPSVTQMKEFPTVTVYGEVNFRTIKSRNGNTPPPGGDLVEQELTEAGIVKSDGNIYPERFRYKTVDIYADFMQEAYQAESSTALRDSLNRKDITVNVLPFRAGMSVTDAILMAGGLKESASESKVVVYRRVIDTKATAIPDSIAHEYEFAITKELGLNDEASKFILEPFDEVYVRRSPAYFAQQKVNISGEVLFPGDYVIIKNGMRLSDFVKKAGGLTAMAYAKGASLSRRKNADELKRDRAIFDAAQSLRPFEDNSSREFNPDPSYNVGINLEAALKKPGSAADIMLRDGDIISIPQAIYSVKISGAVAYPAAMSYSSGMSVKQYINAAGGYSQNARKKPFIIYLNGSVAPANKGKIEPGCEIVVPTKYHDPYKMNSATVVTLSATLLSSFASLAVVIVALIK